MQRKEVKQPPKNDAVFDHATQKWRIRIGHYLHGAFETQHEAETYVPEQSYGHEMSLETAINSLKK